MNDNSTGPSWFVYRCVESLADFSFCGIAKPPSRSVETRPCNLARMDNTWVQYSSQHVNQLTGDKIIDDVIQSPEEPVAVGTAGQSIIFTGVIQHVDLRFE